MGIRYGSVGVEATRIIPPAPETGGGGPLLKDWTELDLTVGNFHQMAQNSATLTNWAFTNPTASTLKIQHNSSSVNKWEGNGQQAGPLLMWKTQIDPRPDYSVSGITDNRWRSEDCLLLLEVRFAGTFENGGVAADARTMGVGPIFVFTKDDHGSGATFVTNNPVPPYQKSSTNAGSYFHARFNRPNDAGTNYDFSSACNQHSKNMNGLTGVLAATGRPNTVQIAVLPHYADAVSSYTGGQSDGTCIASAFDGRVTDGTVPYGVAMQPSWAGNIRVEDQYCYIGIACQNWGSDGNANGTNITIDRIRYVVMPVRNRSL